MTKSEENTSKERLKEYHIKRGASLIDSIFIYTLGTVLNNVVKIIEKGSKKTKKISKKNKNKHKKKHKKKNTKKKRKLSTRAPKSARTSFSRRRKPLFLLKFFYCIIENWQ